MYVDLHIVMEKNFPSVKRRIFSAMVIGSSLMRIRGAPKFILDMLHPVKLEDI